MAKELTELTEVTALPDDAKLYVVDSTRAIADQSVQIAKKNLITINSEPIGNEKQVLQIVEITQANYDLITPIETTFYTIKG